MSIVINLAPLVDMTLSNSVLTTSIPAVGVATSPGFDPVSSYCESRPVLLFLFRSHCAHELAVSDVFSSFFWHFFLLYEANGVGEVFDTPPNAVYQPSTLVF